MMPIPTRDRADAERELVRAIGREVGKDIHDRVADSFERRLRELDRVVSKASNAKDRMEQNLERARAKRMDSQDRLHLAVRQLREQGLELAALRADLDRLRAFAAMVEDEGGPFGAAAKVALTGGDGR